MDKYTVDLDQVLNDFEYSELTDQQSKNASEKPQSTTSFQPAPVIKHSINNVFHSLNEYLNSEIGSSSDKVELRGHCVNYDQQELTKNDNNVIDNVSESYYKVHESSYNVRTGLNINELPNFNNTVYDSSGQNERLLKLKNEPQNSDAVDKTEANFKHVNVRNTSKEISRDQVPGDNTNSGFLSEKQPNLLELVHEGPDTVNNENVGKLRSEMLTESNAPEENNEDLYKTDNQNISLLDMEIVESELIPGLNCTESHMESEVSNVYNDKECDNKSDKINNEQNNAKNESLFEVYECKTDGNKDIVDNSESKEISFEKIENSDDKSSYDNVNTVKNVEKFVIEPSESPYALGNDSAEDRRDTKGYVVTETPFVNNDVLEPNKDTEMSESSKESPTENDEIPKNNQETKEISKHENSTSEIPLSNIEPEIKQDSLLLETTTFVAEDISKSNVDKEVDQKVVGFSTAIDIDENELNKILEDLEIDLDDTITLNNYKKPEREEENQEHIVNGVNKENVEVNALASDGRVDESKDDMDRVDKKKTEPYSEERTDFHKEGSLEKPSHNVKESKENNGNQLIECLEIEKPTKSKAKSTKSKEKFENNKKDNVKAANNSQERPEDAGSMEIVETQSVEEKDVQNVPKNPTIVLQKQQSADSLTRPQDLPLNNEVKEENVKRKIDLIGSPGSTPYNNVYINKSIEPKTAQDTDSDYTSSASPTFSDCSTESTSTASTASVEDIPKQLNDVTKASGKSHGHKHKHSGKGGFKNKGNVQGEQGGDARIDQGERNLQDNSVSNSDQIVDEEGATGLSNNNPSNTEDSNISNPDTSQEGGPQTTEPFLDKSWLGKEAPLWIPDSDAATCLHCDMKFTVLKRRHHCRACGLVLCSKCCNLKLKLEYLDAEARVCTKCFNILNKDSNNAPESGHNTSDSGDSPAFRPNPNNPLEYCSTVSPLQQIGPGGAAPPSVMVPVGVLKRTGSNKKSNKSVMFCDGIAPGSDLTHLDQDFNYQDAKTPKSPQKVPEEVKKKEEPPPVVPTVKTSRNQPKVDDDTGCFIPKSETSLPPTVCVNKTDILYSECSNSPSVVEMLKNEALTFAINQNIFVQVQVINMNCCINKHAWCFSTEGLINVGADEIVYLIEYIDEESFVPKDVFFHINNVYVDAVKGTSIKEQGLSLHNTSNFLDSRNHAGFVYIRPTFQCLENVLKPKEPYLIGILIHRWETPWAKLFPLRLILRLGAEYRYYPSPLISTRHRDSVFVEIGHTIINLLADFRNFTYTLPEIRGLIIHMEEKKTTIAIPRNRYDQVMKSINNSSEHILAFAGNFSSEADSHLVCIQNTQGDENCYTTHAINIHNKPRKVTGASFIVFNGSLKSNSGLTAKSNIVEDGLMIQIPSEHMGKIRDNLRAMKNHTIACGCINATSDETVNIVWGENDVDFNVGIQSPVDLTDMKGIPSIRVHNGKDYFCNNGSRLIRWTEVFILQSGEENPKNQDPVDISKVSESIAKACCTALVKYLDLLVSNSCQKIGIRVTLHVENVAYSAGSNGLKLPPIYMRSLDNELVPVLHRITSNNLGDNAVELELIFRILNA